MKKLILISVMILSSLMSSEIERENLEFTSLCVDEGSTGFNWKNGAWKQVNYAPNKFIIKKIKDSTQYCNVKKQDKKFKEKGLNFSEGCYLMKDMGDKHWGFMNIPSKCNQVWKFTNGKYILTRINCKEIMFQKDGNFVKHSLGANLDNKPKNNSKDSIFVSHGKCSVIH